MMKRNVKPIVILAAILLVVFAVTVSIYSIYNSRSKYKSNVTNAEEVKGPMHGNITKT